MDYLCELPNDAARRKALTTLPPTLHATYQRILQRVNEKNKEVRMLVQRTLRWLVCSREQLSTAALCEAISINLGDTRLDRSAISDEEDIRRYCSSLVRKSISGEYLELAHFTVKEYLLGGDEVMGAALSMYDFSRVAADRELAEVCLMYLTFEDFDEGNIDCEIAVDDGRYISGFHRYAVHFWDEHARKHMAETVVFYLTQQLLHPSKPHNFVFWARERLDDFPSSIPRPGIASISPLHFAAALALPEICVWLLESGSHVHQSSVIGNPLDCALLGRSALFGTLTQIERLSAERQESRSSTLQSILNGGANAQISCSYPSPLYIAIRRSDTLSCIELLRKGATIDPELARKHFYRRSLPGKILKGIGKHDIRDVDRTLLLDAALNSKDYHSKQIAIDYLHSFVNAALYGQIEVLQQLYTDHELDVNAAGGFDDLPALHAAASSDQIVAVRFLIECGADCNLADNDGQTPLHWAVEGSSGCLPTIVNHVDDIDMGDKDGYTVWHLGAAKNNINALNYLRCSTTDGKLHAGVKAEYGLTPLHCAARSGSVEALALFLEDCDEVTANITSCDGSSALHHAVEANSLKAVEYLIGENFNVDALRNDGSNMLHCAIGAGHGASPIIVDLLLAHGANPCHMRDDGITVDSLLLAKGFEGDSWTDRSVSESLVLAKLLQHLTHNVTSLDLTQADEVTGLYQLSRIDWTEADLFIDVDWKVEALEILLKTGVDSATQDQMCFRALANIVESWADGWSSSSSKYDASRGVALLGGLRSVGNAYGKLIAMILRCVNDNNSVSRICSDPNLLCLAIIFKEYGLACELMGYSPSVDVLADRVCQMSPLQTALYYGCSSNLLMKDLIQGSEIDRNTAGLSFELFRLAFHGCRPHLKSIVVALLESGFNADDCDLEGQTVLMSAAWYGDVATVKYLIEHGANKFATTVLGWSAIHYACVAGFEDLLLYLQCSMDDWDSKIDFFIGSRRVCGARTIHLAASLDNYTLTFLLKDNLVADANCLTERQETPLHIAASCGLTRNFLSLLKSHADDGLLGSDDGGSALHVAAAWGQIGMVKIFMERGYDLRLQKQPWTNP